MASADHVPAPDAHPIDPSDPSTPSAPSAPLARRAPLPGEGPLHRERLWVGPAGWVVMVGVTVMVGISFWPVGATVAWVVGAVALAVGVAVLTSLATPVVVTGAELRAGVAHVPVALLGAPLALDAAATRHELGPGLDARAYVCLRGWVRTAVRVPLDDPADPTPYWIVSARRPQDLVRALESATAAARADGTA